MVYCGKPSRGCQMCRTRRIKCDETRPTCNQCAKSRRQCPGYRDEFDIVHRNETQATERRARRSAKKPAVKRPVVKKPVAKKPAAKLTVRQSSPSPSSSSSSAFSPFSGSEKDRESSPASSVASSTSAEVLVRILGLPIQDHAACLFVSNFILVPRHDSSRGFLDFVLPLMKVAGPRSPLAYAFGACAYAALGNRPNVNVSNITTQAVVQYHQSLQALQVSLNDGDSSKSDATLCAVLLLALYEHITNTGMGVGNWAKHVEGAIRLAEARGRDQLRTRRGLLLFIAVRTQMIVHSIASGIPPTMGVEWWVNDAVNDRTATRCQELTLKTNVLRAEVTRVLTVNIRSPEVSRIISGLVEQMQAVERDVGIWFDELPEHWRYMTVAWEDHVPDGDYSRAEVFPGRVDVYRDFWIASVVNMARLTWVTVASTIVRCTAWICAPTDYRTTPEYAASARITSECITDIIASVPYHLGWHLKRPDVMEKANLSGFACGDENAIKSLPGYFLHLPLVCVLNHDTSTDAQRAWARGRLRYVATELGVRYAGVLAKLDVRLPSMHIRRDNLLAKPYPVAHEFEKVLSTHAPRAGGTFDNYPMDPFKQMEALRKGFVDKKKAEMVLKAGGRAGEEGEQLVRGIVALGR